MLLSIHDGVYNTKAIHHDSLRGGPIGARTPCSRYPGSWGMCRLCDTACGSRGGVHVRYIRNTIVGWLSRPVMDATRYPWTPARFVIIASGVYIFGCLDGRITGYSPAPLRGGCICGVKVHIYIRNSVSEYDMKIDRTLLKACSTSLQRCVDTSFSSVNLDRPAASQPRSF